MSQLGFTAEDDYEAKIKILIFHRIRNVSKSLTVYKLLKCL